MKEGREKTLEVLRAWILGVTVSAMVVAGAEALMPSGPVKQVGRLTGGLVLILGLLQPLAGLDYQTLYDLAQALPAGAISQESLAQPGNDQWKRVIEEEVGAYIAEKAAALGAACTARVVCVAGEDGVPVPRQVTVTGGLTDRQREELSRYVEDTLGIPPSGQTYREEGEP